MKPRFDRPDFLVYANAIRATNLDNRGKRIGVLVVAHNAVATLGRVLKRIPPEVFSNIEEVVVFDNASKDETVEVAYGYKYLSDANKLTIFRNAIELGHGGIQKRAYTYFIEKGFDIVVLLHGDGKYAPEVLAAMYAPIVEERADAVIGSRMLGGFGGPLKGGMPFYRYIGNKIFGIYENYVLAGLKLSDLHSGYRAYNLHALRQIILHSMSNEFYFDTEILIKLYHQNFRIVEVPIPIYYGHGTRHVNSLKYAFYVYRTIRRYIKTVRSIHRYPEFIEYFINYPTKDGKYSSHYYFLRLVGHGKKVLDVGCGEGFFAEKLVEQGNEVIGVDILQDARLGRVLKTFLQANLEKGLIDVKEHLAEERFDFILLQDVIEHLSDPVPLLRQVREFLKPNGAILVSVPNIANIWVRVNLLFGRFNYTARGILDRTHLRFFTKKTARELLKENQFEILQEYATVIPIELVLGLSAVNFLIRFLTKCLYLVTRCLPGLFGYQHIFVVIPRELEEQELRTNDSSGGPVAYDRRLAV